jgi:hypothetical protein
MTGHLPTGAVVREPQAAMVVGSGERHADEKGAVRYLRLAALAAAAETGRAEPSVFVRPSRLLKLR